MAGKKEVSILVTLQDMASGNFKKIEASAGSLTSRLGALKGQLAGMAAGAGMAGMAGYAVNAAKDWGLAVDEIIDQTGATGEEASKLMVIAKRIGIGMDESAGMFAKFGKNISMAKDELTKAAAKGEESNDIFSRLELAPEDIKNGSIYEIYGKVAKRMRELGDGADFDRAAMDMFGKSGRQMHDMLTMNDAEMAKVIDKAQKMGLIISGETAGAWEQFDRNLKEVTGSVSKLAIGVGNELLPVMQQKLGMLQSLADKMTIYNQEQRSTMASAVELAAQIGGVTIATRALQAVMTTFGAGVINPWLGLAVAIGGAGIALDDYLSKQSKVAGYGGGAQVHYSAGKYTKEQDDVPWYTFFPKAVTRLMLGNDATDNMYRKELSPDELAKYQENQRAPWSLKGDSKFLDLQNNPQKLNSMQEAAERQRENENRVSAALRPISTGGGGKELDNMREKLANMINDFNAKIMQETGTTLEGNAAKLNAELAKSQQDLNEMAAKGIDITGGQDKLNEYGKTMMAKYTKDQLTALTDLKNETMLINAEVTGDYVKSAEAQYQVELQRIAKEMEAKTNAALANKTDLAAVKAWELQAIQQAQQKQQKMLTDGAAQEHEQRLNSLQYQRDVLGLSTVAFTEAYQRELLAFIDTSQEKLLNANLVAEERMRIEQKVSSSVEQLHKLAGQNINTAWGEAMRRMNMDAYDYSGRITSMFGEMGSSVSTALYETISGTGNGAKDLFKNLCNSILKMWSDMIVQMYIMTPIKNAFFSIFNRGGGGVNWNNLTGNMDDYDLFAEGGLQRGPGTGTSDSIWSRLSNGEYVIKAAAVERYGVGLFDSLNQMRVPAFASGGSVGRRSVAGLANVAPKVEISVVNQTGTQAKARQTSSFSSETNTFIVSVFLEALEGNHGGVRDAVRGVAAG